MRGAHPPPSLPPISGKESEERGRERRACPPRKSSRVGLLECCVGRAEVPSSTLKKTHTNALLRNPRDTYSVDTRPSLSLPSHQRKEEERRERERVSTA